MSGIYKLKSVISIIIIIVFIGAASAIMAGCNGKPTDGQVSENPELYDLIAPDSLIRGLPDTTLMFVSVSDPQGYADIDSVFFTVTKPDGTSNGTKFLMYDDGQTGGDSTAGDSVYTQGIQSPTLQNQLGNYIFSFRARDLSGNYSNSIDKIVTAYDSPDPVLSRPFANQYDAQRRRMFISVRAVDAQGHGDIDSVRVEISFLDNLSLIGSYVLNDLGFYGDSTYNDNIYSGDIGSAPDSIFQAGTYQLQFEAVDYEGHQAVPINLTFAVEPPVL